jgi:putative membrane protein
MGGGFMWIFWIVLLVVLLWALKAATSGRDHSVDRQKSALEILDERYAKGEIDREEFEQKRKDLGG